MKPIFPITKVEIRNTDLEKHYMEDKFSRLDVKATTSNHEMINIEIPKLDETNDEKDLLVAWTEFLKDPESEKVRNIEMSIEEIREAKALLDLLDDETIAERMGIPVEKVRALREQ